MRRNHDSTRRQLGRSTVSRTPLPVVKAQPPVSGTGINSPAGTTVVTSTVANGGRFVRGLPMSVMVRIRPAGVGNTCSNGDLHVAAGEGNAEKVEEHLRSGGDVDVRDGRQWSLLHHASFHGRLAVVGVLLDAGADKEARTAIQLTPLCLACQNGHQEVAEELLRRGASVAGVNATNNHARTDRGAAERANGDGSAVTSVAPTALFIAAREGHLSLVELFLERRGKGVSILRGPDGKFAGDEFRKGVDEEARLRIGAILAEAREKARKEIMMRRDRQEAGDSGDAENQARGIGHHPSLPLHKSQIGASPRLPCSVATPILVGNGHRPDPVPFPSEDTPAPASVSRSEMSMSQPEEFCGAAVASNSTSNHHRPVSGRRSSGSNYDQCVADEADNLVGGDSRNGHHVLESSAGSGRVGEAANGIGDSWPAANPDNKMGAPGGESGSGVSSDLAMPNSDQQFNTPRDAGIVANDITDRSIDGRSAHNRVANDCAVTSGIANTPPVASVFGRAVEQPLSVATITPGTAASSTRGRTSSRGGSDNGEVGVKGGGTTSRSNLALTSPGLPTPQEWQIRVQQNGLAAPVSASTLPHEDKEQTPPRQIQDLSSNTGGSSRPGAAASMGTPSASRGIGAESAILSPVDEVLGGDALADPIQDARSRRSRSACSDRSKVEFGGASPCEQWLKHPMPRSATAPPPSRSPAHMPLSPAGTVGGSVVVGEGDCSEFEDTWRVAFSNLMDLRTLYRINSRSANGRSAAWMGWEEEKRALEETISELNMRLASKDHDIAELHMQLEERERDLRLMHGRDLDRLNFSELSELEQRVQATLVLVQGKRERVVYKLLKEGGEGAGRDSQRPDPVARN